MLNAPKDRRADDDLLRTVSRSVFWNATLLPIATLASLMVSILIRRNFGLQSGVYDVLLGVANTLMFFSGLGLATTLPKFLPELQVKGKCCNFESGDGSRFGIEVSCRHLEQPVDELNLAPHIRAAHPPRLPLPNHVHGLVSLDCPPRRVKLAKPLFGLYPSFDRSMVLLQDIVHVLARPMAAAAAQGAFLFHGWNRRAVEAGLIGVDDAGLRMRWIAERLAKQPFGRRSIAER